MEWIIAVRKIDPDLKICKKTSNPNMTPLNLAERVTFTSPTNQLHIAHQYMTLSHLHPHP